MHTRHILHMCRLQVSSVKDGEINSMKQVSSSLVWDIHSWRTGAFEQFTKTSMQMSVESLRGASQTWEVTKHTWWTRRHGKYELTYRCLNLLYFRSQSFLTLIIYKIKYHYLAVFSDQNPVFIL